jgi:hypothetical protein
MEKIARIYYSWWGNANIKNRLWCLINPDGEVEDYHNRETLVAEAKEAGWKYRVERWSRKERNKMTILEKNY